VIEALPEVKRLWPVAVVHAPKPLAIGVDPKISKWDPHVLTKVNDVHKLGFKGKGIVIAIIDSGIDYTHPSLGKGFGKGFKVDGGWDFVGDRFDPDNLATMRPDGDPMDCLGHGTHVAGIIASSDPDLPGVAPEASLRSYKVFGCEDGTAEDIMAQALIKAHEEGADIISASLGSTIGFPENIVAATISKVTKMGTLVVGSAGNTGQLGKRSTSVGISPTLSTE
jgi:subtilisin family serine protease